MPFAKVFQQKCYAPAKLAVDQCGVDVRQLPNEVISRVLSFLPVPDLLSVCLVNPRFYLLAIPILVSRLRDTRECHLRLFFDQESRWRYTVDMVLIKATTSKFTFVPIDASASLRLFSSKILRNPVLSKVAWAGKSFQSMSQPISQNFLSRSISLNIKQAGHCFKTTDPKNKKYSFTFTHSVFNTPENTVKARPGERWVVPQLFECDPLFVCQRKGGWTRLFETLHSRPTPRGLDGQTFTSSAKLPPKGQTGGLEEYGTLPNIDGAMAKSNLVSTTLNLVAY
ncbi:hypothetical protein J3Q64DRAFT_1757621 [Phycomyces blakesleeanus]|uniref:F-box domain-containing protein n=2 Tax=Phycomyces blakesleeanus TaxID=4837 RepID=A0A167L1I1_PHYB8|nr:hypothetical protein PHYBLDRAFT_66658 [Phycomyces blakesleeanus NRRL 1555(-)]OAD69378.1 hypothetical protein PHYBLDRAFT_66658 [Phycomyces blakesleeanus NRRL 1555(-)]|eukprot:XP_018287418.1 hypothetical protein PHYBLDRAFT_66658 [Phycomyces blakesleeanus NRRL 1555(-)]